ncbi:Alpha/beta hydrolase [Sesbania bispinosa]|nr:Alpha/beta hydrolase [Sesbania bispinosa]
MEDYLLRNEEVFPEPVFEATIWDNTFEKDPGGCPEAERDVSVWLSNEPGSGIVSMKPFLAQPLKPWPNHDRVKVKKAQRGLWTSNPNRLLKKAVANLEG